MFYILLVIVVLTLLFLFYLNLKVKFKSSVMRDNQLLQSEATSSLINKIEKQESAEQEERLMKNARYRALKAALKIQINHYRSLSPEELEKSFKDTNVISKIIQQEGYVFVSKLTYRANPKPSTLHVVVKPKSIFGVLFSVEEWL